MRVTDTKTKALSGLTMVFLRSAANMVELDEATNELMADFIATLSNNAQELDDANLRFEVSAYLASKEVYSHMTPEEAVDQITHAIFEYSTMTPEPINVDALVSSLRDIILKSQNVVEVAEAGDDTGIGMCPTCSVHLQTEMNYCYQCGATLLWHS